MSAELCTHVGDIVTDEMTFVQAMRLLRSYSMIEEVERESSYNMHAVVHRWAFHNQTPELKARLQRLCVGVVGWAVPSSTERNYARVQQRLLPHAQSAKRDTNDGAIMKNQERIGGEGTSTSFITEENELLVAVHLLGNLYASQGKLDETKQMYKRALRGYEKALGSMYISTLDTVGNLGLLCASQGKLDEAEQMYNRALRGREAALGPMHNSILDVFNNLGNLFADQGKLDDAEVMYERALQRYEEALGPVHTSTLRIVNNLGLLYIDQGKLGEAEQMYQRALRGYEEALGPMHTSTLNTINNLGILYADQGKVDEAEQMYERALEGYKIAIGEAQLPTYRPALNSLWGIGDLYTARSQDNKARGYYTQVLSGFSKLCGPSSVECQQIQAALSSLTEVKGVEQNDEGHAIDQSSREVVSDRHIVSEATASRPSGKKVSSTTRFRRKLGDIL